MTLFMYRWNIPLELQEEFQQNWSELTRVVQEKYGMHSATLYDAGNNDLVSITHWSSPEEWEKWRVELADHPFRKKWRAYRVAGPDILRTLVVVEPLPK